MLFKFKKFEKILKKETYFNNNRVIDQLFDFIDEENKTKYNKKDYKIFFDNGTFENNIFKFKKNDFSLEVNYFEDEYEEFISIKLNSFKDFKHYKSIEKYYYYNKRNDEIKLIKSVFYHNQIFIDITPDKISLIPQNNKHYYFLIEKDKLYFYRFPIKQEIGKFSDVIIKAKEIEEEYALLHDLDIPLSLITKHTEIEKFLASDLLYE